MNKLKNLFLRMIPFLLMGWTGYGFYERYEAHQVKLKSLTDVRSGIEGKTKLSKLKLKKITKFKANLEKSKKRIVEVNEQIKKVQRQLPSNINDTDVISQIQEEAELLNLKESVVNPSKEEVKGFYISKEYEFDSIGTYLQFIIFFERLKKAERLYNVKKLVIKNDGVKQKGRFTLTKCTTTLESFKYNAAYNQDSGIEQIEKQYKY